MFLNYRISPELGKGRRNLGKFRNVTKYCRMESPSLLKGCFSPEDVVSVGSLCEVGCERLVSLVLEAGLRIRIHFIRIRIQHFRLNTDPDPGLE
jgi:hypothetical protein